MVTITGVRAVLALNIWMLRNRILQMGKASQIGTLARLSAATLLALLFLPLFLSSVVYAQATSPASINGSFAVGTNNLAGTTSGSSGSATLTTLGSNQGATFDFSASLSGTGTWNSGLRFNSASELQFQARNTNNLTSNFANYTYAFSETVYGLELEMDGLDNGDETLLTFFLRGVQVPVDLSIITGQGSNVNISNPGGAIAAEGPGNDNAQEFFRFRLPLNVAVDEVRFSPTSKNNDSSGNVTLQHRAHAWATGNIALVKISSVDLGVNGTADLGEEITYTFVVTNNGNTPLVNVALADTAFTGAGTLPAPTFQSGTGGATPALLPQGQTLTYETTYQLVAGDLTGNPINNQARVTATPEGGTAGLDDVIDLSDSGNAGDGGSVGSLTEDDVTTTDLPRSPTPTVPPFSCVANFYEVIRGQLSLLDVNTGMYTPIGPSQPRYNATGYNLNDDYVYGLGQAGAIDQHLIRVGSDGNIESFGDVGISSPRGVFDDTNRLFYSSNSTSLSFIDVTTMSLGTVSFTLQAGSANLSIVRDFAYVTVGGEGIIAGASDGDLMIWNLTTGVSRRVDVPGLPNGSYGAAWAASNGSLYFSSNIDGTIYEIANATTAPTIVSSVVAARSNQHDGMSCPLAPPPDFAPPASSIELVKSVSGVADTNGNGVFGDTGDTINFEFTVENTGDAALADISVDDTGLPGVSAVPEGGFDGTLISGEGPVLAATAAYVLTSADVASGSVTNTATVTSTAVALDGSGNPDPANPFPDVPPVTDDSDTGSEPAVDPTDGTVVTVADPSVEDTNGTPGDDGDEPTVVTLSTSPMPSLELVKSLAVIADTNANGIVGDPGDVVNFTFTVKNTGNTALAGISVTDAGLSPITLTPDAGFDGDLAVGEGPVTAATAQYVLTPADVAAGMISNSATAASTPVETGPGNVPVPGSPLINPATGIAYPAGAITDTSDTGTNPQVDPNTGLPVSTIADPSATGGPDDPTVISLITPMPSLSVTKSIVSVSDENGNGLTDVDDIVTYVFNVTNKGNTSLADVRISDPKLGVVTVAVTPADLAPGDTATLTGQTYHIQASDVTAGGVENTAEASGQPVATGPGGTPDPSTPLVDSVGVDLADVTDTSDAGTQPELDNSGSPVGVPNAETTETENLAGNTDGDTTNDPTVLNIAAPQISLIKSVANVFDTNGDGLIGGEDDQVVYSFLVRNTGNVALANVTVTDDFLPVTGGPISLAVGAGDSTTFTATYIVQAADIARGFIENTASVEADAVDGAGNPLFGPDGSAITVSDVSDAGTNPDQSTVTDPEGNETADGSGGTDGDDTNDPTVLSVPANPNQALTIVKSVASVADTNGSGLLDAGDTVTYSFVVTNAGNVRMAGITVTDPRAAPVSGGPITLEAGANDSTTFTASAIITPAEAAAGDIENTATVDGGAVNSAGDPIRNPDTGAQLTATDTSDAGTAPEIGVSGSPTPIPDPTGTGTADDPTVLALPMPSFNLEKSVANVADTNGSGAVDAGDTVTYAFRVRNTGNTDLSNVMITDALPGMTFTTSQTITFLAQGGVNTSVMAQYQLTPADIIAGVVENTALADATAVDDTGTPFGDPFNPGSPLMVDDTSDAGTDPDGATIANPPDVETRDGTGGTDGDPANDPTVFKITPSPELVVTKSVSSIVDTNGNNLVDAGDTVTYAFTVTNTGNIALAGVVVTDPKVAVSGGPIDLAIGASNSTNFTATYVVEALDVTAGFVENTATATGNAVDAAGDPVEDPASPGTPLTVSDTSDAGTNPDLDVTGNPTAVVDPADTETPDATGSIDGNAGNDPTVLTLTRPELELIKSVANMPDTNGDGLFGGEDDVIVYSFLVRNTGNVILNNIMVTDALLPVTDGPITLAPGAGDSLTFTASYTVTAADIARGFVENTATVTGDAVDSSGDPVSGPNGTQITTSDVSDAGTNPDQSTVPDPSGTETPDGLGGTDGNPTNDPTVQTVPGNPNPALTVVKSVAGIADTNGSGVVDEGDTVSYTFTVTNSGNVRLGNVTVADPRAAPVSGGPIILEVGDTDTSTFTASAVITAAEAAAGMIENIARATGGAINSLGDPATGDQRIATDASDAGTEPDIGPTGTPTSIPDPAGTETGGDDPTVLNLPMPNLSVVKSVANVADTNGSGAVDTGDTVSYVFAVSNTGNTDLVNVTVSDALPGLMFTAPTTIPALAQGATDTSVTAEYRLTDADIAAGFVENTGDATGAVVDSDGNPLGDPFNPGTPLTVTDTSDAGTDAMGDPVADPENTETPTGTNTTDGDPGNDPTVLAITPSPAIEVIKFVSAVTDTNGNGLVDAGDVVSFAFTVTNTGNVDLSAVRISDPLANVSGGPILLTIGRTDSSTFTATRVVTAGDVAAGGIENTARAFGTATDADGNVIDNPNNPGSPFEVNDVSDSGTWPDLDGTGSPVDVVDPETTETPDLAGTTDGNAGNDPTVLNIVRPELTLTKSVSNVFDTNNDGLFGGENDEVHFTFFVRNTGNVDLADIMVDDPLVTMSGGPIDLAAGQASSTAFTGIYVVQAADLARGYVENTATATGAAEDSAGNPINGLDGVPITVSDVSDAGTTGQQQDVTDPPNEETPDGTGATDGDPGNDPTVQSLPANPNPSLVVVKSVTAVQDTNGSGVIDAGDMVTYGFTVTNDGNVRLADVSIDDPRAAPVTGGPITLEVGQEDSATFSATAVITAAEADAGAISNTATATGGAVNSAGDPFTNPDTGEQLTASDVSDAGTEPEIGPGGVPADIDDPAAAGAGGDDPTVLALPNPSMELVKSVTLVEDTNGDGLFGSAGDIIRYAFAVTNTGNTTLTDITISDVNATLSGGPISLAPGQTNTRAFTGTHLIIAAEFDAGFVENTATATSTPVDADGDPLLGTDGLPVEVTDISDTGTDSEGDPIGDPSATDSPDGTGATDGVPGNDTTVIAVPTNPRPMIQLVKFVDSVTDADNDAVLGGADDVVTYRFAVTNTGNADLVDVEVNDPLLGGLIGTFATLAIGETQEVFANYTITAENETAGFVQNTATADGDAVNASGAPFLNPDTGLQLTASDTSDAGSASDATDIPDNEGVETPQGNGDTDGDTTNDPTVLTVPLTPSDAAISGTVFADNDRDGVFDPDTDTRLPGYTVILYDTDGNVVDQTVTDSQGMYLMEGFGVGQDYFVEFIDPVTSEVIGTLTNLDFDRNTVLSDQNQEVIAALPTGTLTLTKTSSVSNVVVGQSVPYEIAVTNPGAFTVENVNIVDRLPAGMLYTPGTATVNAVPTEPTIAGSMLTWSNLSVPAGTDSVVITLNARVTSAAALGELTNTASAFDSVTGLPLGDPARATVFLRPEHVFDCSDVIGKVFDDRNANGYQDDPSQPRGLTNQSIFRGKNSTPATPADEPGLPHVRLVTQTGSIITTDEYGRYSVPCAELPGRFGANFSLKLDERSLPSGYRMTTENPRTMRLTAGIMTEMNFGASISRVVDVDLTAAAFEAGSDNPSQQLVAGLEGLLGQIVDTPSVIRIAYFHEGEDRKIVRARGNAVEELIRKRWKRIGRYKLIVERTTKRMQ